MKLEVAHKKAIEYACKKYHYSKSVPVNVHGYSVFEGEGSLKDKFRGVVLFGRGANNNLAKSVGMRQGQVIELVRVALDGKQSWTSKAVAIALRLVKKDIPLAKVCISYADTAQGHEGIIYKATNWDYVGQIQSESAIDPEDGKAKHTRILHSKYGSIKGFERVKDKPKHKFVFNLKMNKVKYNNLIENMRQ